MFNLHDYVMKTLKGMVGNYPEFQVREYALNWYSKGVLTEADLAEVESWYAPEPEPEEVEPVENPDILPDAVAE